MERRSVAGEHALTCIAAVERLERVERNEERVVRRSRGETEHSLLSCLAQVADRVRGDVHVADGAALQRGARTPQRRQAAVPVEEGLVPRLLLAPRHCPAAVLSPLALEAELVAREYHRHARRGHLQADAHELALTGADGGPEPRRVVGVEERPRVQGHRPRHARAEPPHHVDHLRSGVLRRRRGREGIVPKCSAVQPPGHRTQEARVVHRAVPAGAVEVGAKVVAVLGHEQRAVRRGARPPRDVVVQVDRPEPPSHVRHVDAPAVEAGGEPMAEDRPHARVQLAVPPIELGQRWDAEPRRVAARQRVVEEVEAALGRVWVLGRRLEPLVPASRCGSA